ncbi:MAG: hypothetical protein ACQERB_16480, partial [Promethearchaeati archaeon]
SVPDEYLATLQTVSENGFVVPYSGRMKDTIDRRREKMNLPQIEPPNLNEVNFIIEDTGLGHLLKKENTKEEKK